MNKRDSSSPMAKVVLATVVAAAAGQVVAAPHIEHWQAETGARVYFVESRALPLIDVRIDFAAGSAYDPRGLEGLAAMTRALVDTGTEGLDEQEISEAIADTGAQLGGSTDRDQTGLTIRTLSSEGERNAAVTLAARLLARPAQPRRLGAYGGSARQVDVPRRDLDGRIVLGLVGGAPLAGAGHPARGSTQACQRLPAHGGFLAFRVFSST